MNATIDPKHLLAGVHVLIAEDEAIIAMDLEDLVETSGGVVSVSVDAVADALDHLDGAEVDVALLDINLLDGDVLPLAEALQRRSIPMVFVSGNPKLDDYAKRFASAEALSKPAARDDIAYALHRATRRDPGRGAG